MNLKTFALTSTVAFSILSGTSIRPAVAADKPASPGKPASSTTQPAQKTEPTVPLKLSAQELATDLKTVDDYAAILQKAGYTVNKGKTASGEAALSISWKQGNWSYIVRLTLNDVNGIPYLSLVSPLANIPDKVPVTSVVNLLRMQDATQGWYFVLNTNDKRFYIVRSVPVEKFTAKSLLRELSVYEADVQGTARWWNPSAWNLKPAQPAQSEAPSQTPSAPKSTDTPSQ